MIIKSKTAFKKDLSDLWIGLYFLFAFSRLRYYFLLSASAYNASA